MRAFPTRSWAAFWLVCQMLASLAPVFGSCCPDPTRVVRHEEAAGDDSGQASACPMHRADSEAPRGHMEDGAACPMHPHGGRGSCCRLTAGAGCEPHEMAVVVPAVLTEAPVFGPVPSPSTPVSVRSDRLARLASSPDLPPPRA